jgi:hypothetical protein
LKPNALAYEADDFVMRSMQTFDALLWDIATS